MRVDRRDSDNSSDRKVTTALVSTGSQGQASSSNFASALQQHRQRTVTHSREPHHPSEEKPRRVASQQNASAGTAASSAVLELHSKFDSGAPQSMLSLLSTLGDTSGHAAANTAMPRPMRPRRTLADPESSHCIEVTHPRTGMQFVLSQKDGVWQLSIDARSQLDPGELQSFLESLREQFAARGLGPVDVIV